MDKFKQSRRQFLTTLNLLWAYGALGGVAEMLSTTPSFAGESDCLLLGNTSSKSSSKYKVLPWTGDDMTLGHELRNGDLPKLPSAIEKTYDFVIVGGGIAGLTSAYFLKDHNYLLLEQYAELGGQSRGSNYRGIDFSYGPAYVGDLKGLSGQLFAELKLDPYKLTCGRNSWYCRGEWLPGVDGNKQQIIYKEFARLFAEAQPIWKQTGEWQGSMPTLTAELKRLDSIPFSSVLASYDRTFVEYIDRFCKSTLCGGVSNLSALAGYMLMQDPKSEAHVFKGGNPAIANALKQRLNLLGANRNQTGTFVWRIDLTENGATVIYQDKLRQLHKVACRRVIVCTPPLVTARIISNLDDATKAQLLAFKYGSYLVANFCMKKKVFDGSYDNWVGSPFSFTDVITAETPYIASKTYTPSMGLVLTLYNPWAPGTEGRDLLYKGDRAKFANSLVLQLNKLVPQFDRALEQIVLSRWGHAMAVARPSFFSNLNKLQSRNNGPCILAHNTMHGLPCAESAIGAARRAADLALGKQS